MLSDLRFAFRALFKTPGFTAAAILILAIGIGANTAVFSVVEAVLLRPLPYDRPQELVSVYSAISNQFGLFNVLEYRAYRDETKSFSGMAAITAYNTNLVDAGEAQLVQGLKVTSNTFQLLGVRPVIGRMLVPSDDRPDAAKVAVISHAEWQRAFGGRADVVGRQVTINGETRTIVGVMPPDFIMPVNNRNSDVCVPFPVDVDATRDTPAALHYMRVIARVRPGVTPAQMAADTTSVLNALRHRYAVDFLGERQNKITALNDEIVGDTGGVLLTLLGVVGSLLLLACANLAGLLLVRGLGRQRELAIRTALGSSRTQLMRLLLAECLVLALLGGIAGLGLAQWSIDALLTLMPAGVPRAHGVQFNGTVLGFTLLVTLLAGVLPGVAPLWFCSRLDLRSAVNAEGRGNTGGRGQMRARHILAAVQIALALTLLACTGLFLRSFWALNAQRPGADPAHILTARITLPEAGYPNSAALIRYSDALRARLAAIPGVEQVGSTSLLPLATGLATTEFHVSGEARRTDTAAPSANYRLVTPGFFEAMGIRLRDGRLFTASDDEHHPVEVIVSRALADAFFPNHDAVGHTLEVNDNADGFRTELIVGVVDDVKQSKLEDAPSYDLYVPFRQMTSVAVPWMRLRTYWVLRTAAPATSVETALRGEVRALDPSVPVAAVSTMEQVADTAMAVRRFTLIIVAFLAGAALVLTIAGVYATIAYGITQRTREMGVRLALGATAGQIFRLVVGEGLVMAGTGALLGLLVAIGLSHLVAAQLYGVSPRDPLALAAAAALLLVVAFLACSFPARRASQVDPLVAMRAE